MADEGSKPHGEGELVAYNRFPELVPREWFAEGEEPVVWMRAYLTMGIPMDPEKRSASFDVELPGDVRVCVHLRHGAFTAPPELRLVPKGHGQFGGEASEKREYADDVYLVLMTPVDPEIMGEGKARQALDSVAGMISATVSPNMTYLRLFEHAEWVNEGRSFVPSESIRNPNTYRKPELSDRFVRAAKAVTDAQESLRNRVMLSARWLQGGVEEGMGVDAFIKLWVAIEALVLESASTKPLKELLATAYGVDVDWVTNKLKIDRLAQRRGDILHNGRMPPIRGDLLRFLVALYEDALAARLELPFERRAEAFIDSEALKFL